MHSFTTGPTPRQIAEAALTWVDLVGFWITAVGVLVSFGVGAIALWISLESLRESRRRQLRMERAEWVRLYGNFLNEWVRNLSRRAQVRVKNRDWNLRYDELLVSALMLESQGAKRLLDQAWEATEHVRALKASRREKHHQAENSRASLMGLARAWVMEPASIHD